MDKSEINKKLDDLFKAVLHKKGFTADAAIKLKIRYLYQLLVKNEQLIDEDLIKLRKVVRDSTIVPLESAYTKCTLCNRIVRKSVIESHNNKCREDFEHRRGPFRTRSKYHYGTGNEPIKTRHDEKRLDGSREFPFNRRESGRFGSHSSFDDSEPE